jgi:hypothetical protein
MAVKVAGGMTRPSKSANNWKLVSSEEATPLKLEEPNTTMVLSASESEWFRRVHIEVLKGPAAAHLKKASRSPKSPKSR